jgi:hypothetical protein
MKKLVYVLLIVLTSLLAGGALAGNGNGWGNGPGNRAGGSGSQPPPTLSDDERENLVYIREEEKLACDTYLKLYEEHGVEIFATIALSEDRHMEAMLNMLLLYDVPDPVGNNAVGEFTDEAIGKLYLRLVNKGLESLEDALEVGVIIETKDINDLQMAILATQKDPLINAYSNLLEGSRRHLEAFENQIAGLDVIVISDILDPEYLGRIRGRCSQQGELNGPR